LYSQVGETWHKIFKEKAGDILARAIELRRSPTIVRLERPSRLDRARKLGYKAKQGVAIVRIKVSRGGMRRKRPVAGRRSKHMGVNKMKANVSTQDTAERRVGEKYPNMNVIGSYLLWKDGKHAWFECILIDPVHPSIANDYNYRRLLGHVG
jgi:large subunit ribosomal protein L15e